MGVPQLFPYIKNVFSQYPGAIQHFQQGERTFRVNNLYIDGNAILHGAAQQIFHYGQNKRELDPYASLSYSEKLRKTFEVFFNLILQISQIVVPTSMLYVAIDGSAPLAKQAQQRQRRFAAAKGRDISARGEGFDSNSITPGTLFMLELTKFINYAIRKEMTKFPQWKNIEVVFSPPTVPGEGEHKLLDYIRFMEPSRRNSQSHCLFGPDGDLIMLTLAAHVPKMFLFREDQYTPGYYHLLDMGIVRNGLADVLGLVPGLRIKTRTINDVSNDFILAGFFVGNDFLPKIQMFYLLQHGLELMIDTYHFTSKGGTTNVLTYKANDGYYYPNHQGFTIFVKELAKNEKKYLFDQSLVDVPDPRFVDHTLLKRIANGVLDFQGYRLDYYAKSGIRTKNADEFQQQVGQMCWDYLHTIAWVFNYYTNGLSPDVGWRTYYPWHYAPLMTDLADYMIHLTKENQEDSLYVYELGKPSLPFVQLLSVLPAKSANLLPGPFRKLMRDPNSVLVKAGYYPSDFGVDYEGKTKEHMGVSLLSFVDIDTIVQAYTPIADNLKNWYVRNSIGRNSSFTYDPSYRASFASAYGNISQLRTRKTLL